MAVWDSFGAEADVLASVLPFPLRLAAALNYHALSDHLPPSGSASVRGRRAMGRSATESPHFAMLVFAKMFTGARAW